MAKRKTTRKYYFSVEGETEKWYLNWLQKTINDTRNAKARVSFSIKVEKNPCACVNRISSLQKTTELVHVVDVEGSDISSRKTFSGILGNLSKAMDIKSGIRYSLGYCNLSFELWIILHKTDCFGTFSSKDAYLPFINREYKTHFSGMRDYKKEGNLCKDIINNYCYVKVNPKNPSFNLSINDDDSLMFEVNDNDNSLRSIRLYLYNNNLEYFFDYPIFNGAVIINNVNVNETYNFSIMIGYYSGGEISYTNEIITGKIAIEDSELVLGNIYLLNSNESDIRCSIEVNDLIQGNELQQLSYLNNDIILDSKFSYFPVIIFSLVVGGLLFGTIIIFRNKRINKF